MVTPNSNAVVRLRFLQLPPHDYETYTYAASGAADNDLITTVTGFIGGANGVAVGTLTFAYVGSTNNVDNLTLTLPTANG